jgi:hypothetical protein
MKIKRNKKASIELDKVFKELAESLNIEQLKLFMKYIELKHDCRINDLNEIMENLK